MRARGFTLLEILLAMSLTGILLASIYGIFSSCTTLQQRLERRADRLHLVRVLVARLDREFLSLAFSDSYGRELLAGGLDNEGRPYVTFCSWHPSGRENGIRQIRYWLEADDTGTINLWRTESLDRQPATRAQRLSRDLDQLQFEFYDGSEWQQEWSSRRDGRPKLVRVSFELPAEEGQPGEKLSTIFNLPQAEFSL